MITLSVYHILGKKNYWNDFDEVKNKETRLKKKKIISKLWLRAARSVCALNHYLTKADFDFVLF